MKKILKATAAILAAATMTFTVPMTAAAASLKADDGLMYIQEDSSEASLYTGWTKKAGKRYYYKDGVKKKNCWVTSKGERKYYLTGDGSAAVGKVTISGVEYEFDEKGRLVKDDWGITVTAEDVTADGLKMVFTFERPADNCTNSLITSEGKYISVFTGDEYLIEKYEDGKWKEVPYKADGWVWTDMASEMNGGSEFKFDINWKELYGTLESGRYRVKKTLYSYKTGETYTSYTFVKYYYAYFDID